MKRARIEFLIFIQFHKQSCGTETKTDGRHSISSRPLFLLKTTLRRPNYFSEKKNFEQKLTTFLIKHPFNFAKKTQKLQV